MFESLYAIERGRGNREVEICGHSFISTKKMELPQSKASIKVIPRSLLKPWQFMPMIELQKEADWSMAIASHSGHKFQVDAVENLKQRYSVDLENLKLPTTYPMDCIETFILKQAKNPASKLYHPCCSKHMAMYIYSVRKNYDPLTYWQSYHPIQRQIYDVICDCSGEFPSITVDSCGLPNFVMSLGGISRMWKNLATVSDLTKETIIEMFLKNPDLIGGPSRLDSEIMKATNGQVIAKEGADGLLIVQALAKYDSEAPTAFVKIASGYNSDHLAIALYCELAKASNIPQVFLPILDFLTQKLTHLIHADQRLIFGDLL